MFDERELSRALHADVDELLPTPELLSNVRAGGRRRLARRRAGAALGTLSVTVIAVTAAVMLHPVTSGDAVPPAGSSTPQPTLAKDSSARRQLVLQAHDAAVANYATDVLIERCMKTAGFDYVLLPKSKYSQDLPHEYGESVGQAEAVGYNLKSQTRVNPARIPANGNAKQRQTYDKCQTAAQKAVFGDPTRFARDSTFTLTAQRSALSDAGADPRVRWLDKTWSTCMRDKGYYLILDPSTARSLARSVLDESNGRQQEIAIATADAQCEQRVGYAQRERVEDAYLEQEVSGHQDLLADGSQMYSQARQRAEQILAASPSPTGS
jgi:hypothetical protein